MKKFFAGLFIAVLCIALIVLAYAEEESAPCYTPVLMDWDAKDGKDLEQKILEYWRTNAPGWEAGLYTPQKRSMTFRLGGTTEELIEDYRNWDIAIVSSKEVDLQKLADEGVVISCAYNPSLGLSLHHSLLPEAVRKKLPIHPLYDYMVYCYDYNPQTDEAIFLVCNEKKRPAGSREGWVMQILKKRGPDRTRALEDICRVNDWTQMGVPPCTVDELLQMQNDWDWASLRIDETDRLEALDQEGLLYDFSQDSYWVGREPAWQEPKGLFSADGRMIGIPYNPIITGEYEPNTILVFIVNAKSAHSLRALEYAKHFVKSYEWVYNVIETGWSDPDIEKKYGEHSICIYKDEVDW